MKTDIPSIMPGAEPFFHKGGDVGCLCLHGLTASPAEVYWLGLHLAECGMTVHVPRIAGHGADYRHLRRKRWQDWYLSVLDGYHLLRGQCSKVYVAGLSMGGLLALLLAAAQQVDGLVVMAAPVKLPDARLLPYARWIKFTRPFSYMPGDPQFTEHVKKEQKRRGDVPIGRVRYDIWANQALEEFYKLMNLVDTHLPDVTAPALLLYSRADATVPLLNQQYIHDRLSSTIIETHTYETSSHILTQDHDYQDVLQRTAEFIRRHAET